MSTSAENPLEDFFGIGDPLDPELKAFLTTSRVLGGAYVKHPLVFGPAQIAGHLNRQLQAKKEALAAAEARADWQQWLWLHERPWRIPKLSELMNTRRVERDVFKKLLISAWMDTEFPWQFRRTPLTLFQYAGFVTDAQAEWDALPGRLVVYRGDSRHPRLSSLSWTLSLEKGRWYAQRWATIKRIVPTVWQGDLIKAHALGFITGRGELEVVVSPRDLTNVHKLQKAL